MVESPRLCWVRDNAQLLSAIAARYGARRVCLCGSVARGQDQDGSDIDLYIFEFDPDQEGHDRADALIAAIRDVSPYPVDVRGHDLPGWPVDPAFEENMQKDALGLSAL